MKRADFLNQSAKTNYRYAIIGAGEHATSQLYPCIWHIGIPIALICTKTSANAIKAATRFANCRGTDKLDDILSDSSIKGVFVSTPPTSQAELVKQLLAAGKSVYVEKPLAYSEHEFLSTLPNSFNATLRVGLQRRYAPIGRLTKKLLKQPISYQYSYRIGAYPEGNVLFELFIHQLDYCLYLFGSGKLIHVSRSANSSGETLFIQLDHSGVIGNIELTTQYSWSSVEERLHINQQNSTILSDYPSVLERIDKPSRFIGVPLEKVIEQPTKTRKYLTANNSVPSIQNSSANTLGFYPSIYSFFQATEKNEKSESEINHLTELYRLLDKLKQA